MNSDFYKHLFDKQQKREAVPSNDELADWALKVICLIYPEQCTKKYDSVDEIVHEFKLLEVQLKNILDATKACITCNTDVIATSFFEQLPEINRVLNTDIHAILNGDPAAISEFEVIRTYPGFYAICFYRIAHALLKLEVPLLPRILTEYAHSKTGIDIHPGAEIGEYLHIDHGTGMVIGGTCKIGKHVKFYQGITLGALSVDKSMANTKRHPTVEDHVVIYSGATILGGETTIGHNSIIGGNVWLTKSIPPYSTVTHKAQINVVERTQHND